MNSERKMTLYYDNLEIPLETIKHETNTIDISPDYAGSFRVATGYKTILEFKDQYRYSPVLKTKKEYWVRQDKYLINYYCPNHEWDFFTPYSLTMKDPLNPESIKIPEQLCLK